MDNLKPDEVKAAADTLFRQGNFAKAAEGYTNLMLLDKPNEHIYYSLSRNFFHHKNRSVCNLKLKKAEEGLEDADACIQLKPDFFKGHVRRAFAMFGLKNLNDALASLWRAIGLEPNSPDYLPFIAKCILTASKNHDPFAAPASASSPPPFQSPGALKCIAYALRTASPALASSNALEPSIMFLADKVSSVVVADELYLFPIFKSLLTPQSSNLTLSAVLLHMCRFMGSDSAQKSLFYPLMKSAGLFVAVLRLLQDPGTSDRPYQCITDLLRTLSRVMEDDAHMIELFMEHDAATALASIFPSVAGSPTVSVLYCCRFIHKASLLTHEVRIKLRDAGLIDSVYNAIKFFDMPPRSAEDQLKTAMEFMDVVAESMREARESRVTPYVYPAPFTARTAKFDDKTETYLKEQGYGDKFIESGSQDCAKKLMKRFLGSFLLSDSFWTEEMVDKCGWRSMLAVLQTAAKDAAFQGNDKLEKLNELCWPRLQVIFERHKNTPAPGPDFGAASSRMYYRMFLIQAVREGAVAPGFKPEFAKNEALFIPLLKCMVMICGDYDAIPAMLEISCSPADAQKIVQQFKADVQALYRKIITEDILGHYQTNTSAHIPLFQFVRAVLSKNPTVVMEDIYFRRAIWKLLVDAVQPAHSFLKDIQYFEAAFRLVEGCLCTPGTVVVESWQKFKKSLASLDERTADMKCVGADLMADANRKGVVVPFFFQPLASSAIRHVTTNNKRLILDVLNWIVATCRRCESVAMIRVDNVQKFPIEIDFKACPGVAELIQTAITRYPQTRKELVEKISEVPMLAKLVGIEAKK